MSTFLSHLSQAFQMAPSPDNSQPHTATWDGKRLSIRYDHARVAEQTFPGDSPATLITLGAAIENVSELLTAAGIKHDINNIVEGEIPGVDIDIALPNEEPDAMHTAALFERHTNRFGYENKKVDAELLDSLANMNEGSCKVSCLATADSRTSLWTLVKSASEIRFQTREVHEWLGKSLRFTPAKVAAGDGLDLKTMDLPPGGGLFMKFIADWARMNFLNKFGAYKLLSQIDSAPIKKGPAVIAISGPKSQQGAIDAGRTITRLWNHLNNRGLAVHPYYVVADQMIRLESNAVPDKLIPQAEALAENTRNLLSLDSNEILYMLLRVGYAKKEAPRSKRLPVKRVFKDLTVPE